MTFGIGGLSLFFFLTAALYASVGFGGGSTYIALLALADIDYRLLPIIALLCNIIVVIGGTIRFQARGLIEWKRIWPILILSVPAAWLGGRIPVNKELFLVLLGISLTAAALLLLIEPAIKRENRNLPNSLAITSWFAPLTGGVIGFLSGIVGIGGGIFLAPVLFLTRWSDGRRIAATASIFILVNSISGLAGQMMKSEWQQSGGTLTSYWPLFLSVLIGGQIGSFMASKVLPEVWIRVFTAILILYISVRILIQQAS